MRCVSLIKGRGRLSLGSVVAVCISRLSWLLIWLHRLSINVFKLSKRNSFSWRKALPIFFWVYKLWALVFPYIWRREMKRICYIRLTFNYQYLTKYPNLREMLILCESQTTSNSFVPPRLRVSGEKKIKGQVRTVMKNELSLWRRRHSLRTCSNNSECYQPVLGGLLSDPRLHLHISALFCCDSPPTQTRLCTTVTLQLSEMFLAGADAGSRTGPCGVIFSQTFESNS